MTALGRLPQTAAALFAAAVLLIGCGGVDTGGTGLTTRTESVGLVSGLGSVIVNGVRYDDVSATVVDDDGVPRSPTDLKLGMVIAIEGDIHADGSTGVARRIQFGNEIAGPVTSVNTAGQQLVVLGQTVRVNADTLFSGYVGGLGAVAAGDLLEVFGFQDPVSAGVLASRIERKTTLSAFKLRGRISGLSLDGNRFSIGGAPIDASQIAALPTLADGLSVRVSLLTTPQAGRWVATSVHTSQRHFPANQAAEVEGFISNFVSRSNFEVGGVTVNAGGPGVDFRRGSVNQLANGMRVEVDGEMRNGVLVASRVEYQRGSGGERDFELHGAIESIQVGSSTFVLRGVTVAYGANTVFAAGTQAGLVVGARVEVKGSPTADGTGLLARQVRFER